jgi:hypothetical protein
MPTPDALPPPRPPTSPTCRFHASGLCAGAVRGYYVDWNRRVQLCVYHAQTWSPLDIDPEAGSPG